MTTDTITPTPLTLQQDSWSRFSELEYPHGGMALQTLVYGMDAGNDLQAVGNTISSGQDPSTAIAQTDADLTQMLKDYVAALPDIASGIKGAGGSISVPYQFVTDVVNTTSAALGAGNAAVDTAVGGLLTHTFQNGIQALAPQATFS